MSAPAAPVAATDAAPTPTRRRPPVRTFKPRRRALSPAREALLDRLSAVWCVDPTGCRIDPVALFGRRAPLVLDIGIGFGDALTAAAAAEPGVDVIGADVHTPGIAATLAGIEALGLGNVRLYHGDALELLDRIAPGSLAGIRIYFPDPWPKARHHHRRLVGEANVERFVDALAPGGWVHVATDITDYAAQAARVCGARTELSGGVVARPAARPLTRYERKGLAAGRAVTDLVYRKRDPLAGSHPR